MKDLTSSTFMGATHSMMALIFSGSTAMPSLETTSRKFLRMEIYLKV